MVDLIRFAAELQEFFAAKNWKFCFIGGLALQVWGEPRLTRDIDVSLFTGFGREEEFITELLNRFPARISDPARFALQNRVILLSSDAGIPFDVALAGFPFEETIIEQGTTVEFLEGVALRVCSANDLIFLKAFAARPKDWMDIESIILRQGAKLDQTYVQKALKPLCELKGDLTIPEKLEELFGRIRSSK